MANHVLSELAQENNTCTTTQITKTKTQYGLENLTASMG